MRATKKTSEPLVEDDELLEDDPVPAGGVRFPQRIHDPYVDRVLASADLPLLRALEAELRSRYRHEYEQDDPRRQRYDRRLERVRQTINVLERRSA